MGEITLLTIINTQNGSIFLSFKCQAATVCNAEITFFFSCVIRFLFIFLFLKRRKKIDIIYDFKTCKIRHFLMFVKMIDILLLIFF